MASEWLVCIILGIVLYGITYAPVFPGEWTRLVRYFGGILILIGIIIFILALFGIITVDNVNT